MYIAGNEPDILFSIMKLFLGKAQSLPISRAQLNQYLQTCSLITNFDIDASKCN